MTIDTTLYVTQQTGGKARMTPMTVVEPEHQLTHGSFVTVAADTPVDRIFLAGFLSACLMQARCMAHLYRAVAARTYNEAWRVRYQTSADQSERHVTGLADLVGTLHGDPQYISPMARLTEARHTRMMEIRLVTGCADLTLMELTDLEMVLSGAWQCQADGAVMQALAQRLPDGETRRALTDAGNDLCAEAGAQVTWAQEARQALLISQTLTPMP